MEYLGIVYKPFYRVLMNRKVECRESLACDDATVFGFGVSNLTVLQHYQLWKTLAQFFKQFFVCLFADFVYSIKKTLIKLAVFSFTNSKS